MSKGNVLVIGNSGVGKSTLINAVLGKEVAKTGYGIHGTTLDLEIYGNETVPFRIIDTIGFEPNIIQETKAIRAVKSWSRKSAKEGDENTQINVIWFCVDGTSRKLFPRSIQSFLRATSIWKNVPVIAVITKSFSRPDRKENIELVEKAFSLKKQYKQNLKCIIPVVASTYVLNDSAFAPPEGLSELIDATNNLMPEGKRAAEQDIAEFKLARKRNLAHGVVALATTAGVGIGIAPTTVADALLLTPLEIGEINAVAAIYGIPKNDQSKQFIDSIIEVGTVSAAAKAAVATLKSIPGISLGASVINAIIAGCIVAGLGEGTIYAFEQINLGKKTFEDIDWLKKVINSKLSTEFFDKIATSLQNTNTKLDATTIADTITAISKSL